MGDLFSEIMSASAASSAADASRHAQAAQSAAEEKLEGNGSNPFITFELCGFYYPEKRFFSDGRKKLGRGIRKVSLKRTDIAFLSEEKDDFGTTYTVVHLEGRCNLSESKIYVAGSMLELQTYINNQ